MKPYAAALSFILALTITPTADAQDTPSMGSSDGKERIAAPFQTYPYQEWQGRRVVFLRRPQPLQEFGYSGFGIQTEPGAGQRQYDDLVGRMGNVVAIRGGEFPELDLKMDDGKTITGNVPLGTVPEVALMADIDSAKARYAGKTLWVRKEFTSFTDMKSDTDFIYVDANVPVNVVDVVAGMDHESPIRFVIRTPKGETAYADVHMSNTNVSPTMQKYSRFNEIFLETNPAVIKKWSKKTRDAISRNEVETGMTVDQVRMSVGYPDAIYAVPGTPARREWVYGDRHLFVEQEKVVEIAK